MVEAELTATRESIPPKEPQLSQVENAPSAELPCKLMKTKPIVFELMAETVLDPQPSVEDTHGSFGLEALAELMAEMDKEENQSLSCLEMVEALTASNIQVTTEEPILQTQVSSTKSMLPKKVSGFREAP